MKLLTKLRWLTAVSLLILLAILLALAVTTRRVHQAARESQAANEMIRGLFELGILTTDYLLHNGDRARHQWEHKHVTLTALLSEARFRQPADRRLLERVRANNRHVRQLFHRLVILRAAPPGTDSEATTALRRRLIGQLDARTQAIASDASALAERSSERMTLVRRRAIQATVAGVVVVAGFMLTITLLFSRSVARPIHRLHVGTEIIGSGDFDHRVGTLARDEIGQLSRAFDDMTARLKRVTVSRDDLVREIEKRRLAEEDLQLFFEVTIDLPCFADLQGHFLRVTPAWSKTLGWSESELLAKPYLEFVHPDDQAQTRSAAAGLTQGGEVIGFDNRYRCRNGTYRWLSWNAVALPDRGIIIALARDVTDRKRVEQELARSNQELEQFAYIVSHDLQEPLRAVSGFVDLLQRRYRELFDEKGREYVRFVAEGATRMHSLITGLLAYSRVNTRGRPFEPVDCAKLCAGSLANLRMSIEESGAVVTHDPLPVVRGDRVQLGQVFQNLLGNALKFRGQSPPVVHVRAERQPDAWRFAVRDNGIGIDPSQFERVFVIFQRLHAADQYPGTGLGLAICKKIVERHGGRIWLESAPGQGSTFSFTIADHTREGTDA